MVVVYGKKGCGLCDAAKEKLDLLKVEWMFVDLEDPGEDWRNNGATDAMAMYSQIDTLPIVRVGAAYLTYSESMKQLKKQLKKPKKEGATIIKMPVPVVVENEEEHAVAAVM